MNYREIMATNLQTIEAVNPAEYPNLSKWLNRTGAKYYRQMIEICLSFAAPFYQSNTTGKAFFAVTRQRLMAVYGGSPYSWQSAIIVLSIAGMLERIEPNENTSNEQFRKLYDYAKTKNHKPETVYHFPAITADVLEQGEFTISRLNETGVRISHITRQSVIMAFGKDYAEKLYHDKKTNRRDETKCKEETYTNRRKTTSGRQLKPILTGTAMPLISSKTPATDTTPQPATDTVPVQLLRNEQTPAPYAEQPIMTRWLWECYSFSQLLPVIWVM